VDETPATTSLVESTTPTTNTDNTHDDENTYRGVQLATLRIPRQTIYTFKAVATWYENSVEVYLGTYYTPLEAAVAHDQACLRMRRFDRINFTNINEFPNPRTVNGRLSINAPCLPKQVTDADDYARDANDASLFLCPYNKSPHNCMYTVKSRYAMTKHLKCHTMPSSSASSASKYMHADDCTCEDCMPDGDERGDGVSVSNNGGETECQACHGRHVSHTCTKNVFACTMGKYCTHIAKSLRLLKNHQKWHTGDYYYCSECKYASDIMSQFVKHMKTKHGIDPFYHENRIKAKQKKLQKKMNEQKDHTMVRRTRNRNNSVDAGLVAVGYTCSDCNKIVETVKGLKRHRDTCKKRLKNDALAAREKNGSSGNSSGGGRGEVEVWGRGVGGER
jgi:hypothetical protein